MSEPIKDRREAVRRILAECVNYSYDDLEPHDFQAEADRLLALWASVDEENAVQRQQIADLKRRMALASEGVTQMVALHEEDRLAAQKELEDETAALRQDLEDLQNQREDWQAEKARLEAALRAKEVVEDSVLRDTSELERQVRENLEEPTA